MAGPYLIAIAGLVGVGKTTLAENLAQFWQARLIREEYDQNPWHTQQLQGNPQASLPSELFFLLSRARQLCLNTWASEEVVVVDYLFDQNRLFAQTFLRPEQMKLFLGVEKTLKEAIYPPNVVIYLTDTIEHCLQRIHKRGRPVEVNISKAWLEKMRHSYEELLGNWSGCPVVQIDCHSHDVRSAKDIEYIAQKVADAGGLSLRKQEGIPAL